MAFTTWQTLYQSMLDDLANQRWIKKSYSIGKRQMEFRDTDEFLKMLEFVKRQANEEVKPSGRRTYAKNGRRGS